MVNGSTKNGGIGFLSLLGLLFIGLKLAGAIDWAWWVVLAPSLITSQIDTAPKLLNSFDIVTPV